MSDRNPYAPPIGGVADVAPANDGRWVRDGKSIVLTSLRAR